MHKIDSLQYTLGTVKKTSETYLSLKRLESYIQRVEHTIKNYPLDIELDSMKLVQDNINYAKTFIEKYSDMVTQFENEYEKKNLELGDMMIKSLFDMNNSEDITNYFEKIQTKEEMQSFNNFLSRFAHVESSKEKIELILQSIADIVDHEDDFEQQNNNIYLNESLSHPGNVIETGIGDCEDFATTAFIALKSSGIQDMHLVLMGTTSRIGHVCISIPVEQVGDINDAAITYSEGGKNMFFMSLKNEDRFLKKMFQG